jgi:hypothetical protein
MARVKLFNLVLHSGMLAHGTALNRVLTTSAKAGFI